jgi:histone deacetylase 6
VTDAEIQKQQSLFLAHYLWENYIQPSSSIQKIFFVGIGNAFQGIARLLSEKQDVHGSVGGVVAFIASNPLRPVSNDAWEGRSVSTWYAENSVVWVSPTHQVWKRDKRLSKKFGGVRRSNENVLGMMVRTHMEEAWGWIRERARDPEETMSEGVEEKEDLVVGGMVVMSGREGEAGDGDGDVEMDH